MTCVIRPSVGPDLETDAEIGTSPTGQRLIWPVGEPGFLAASDAPAQWRFMRLHRAFLPIRHEVDLDLSDLNYLETRALARSITEHEHAQRVVYRYDGHEVYDSDQPVGLDHLAATLLVVSDILTMDPGLARRRAAVRQLDARQAEGRPLDRCERRPRP